MQFIRNIIVWMSVLGIAFLAQSAVAATPPDSQSSLAELPDYLAALVDSQVEDHFLIVTVAGTDDFLQFIATDRGVLMDHALFTDRQQSMAPVIAEVCSELGLVLEDNGGSYNWIVAGDLKEIGATITAVFERAFDLESDSPLVYEHHGLQFPEAG